MGRFLCGVERVKRFVNVHLHYIKLSVTWKLSAQCRRCPCTENFCGRPWPVQMHYICLAGFFRKGVV